MKKSIVLISILVLTCLFVFYVSRRSQVAKANDNDTRAAESVDAQLGAFFPINKILKVKVSNFYGTRYLTEKEHISFKKELSGAVCKGGPHIKPGHIGVVFEMSDCSRFQAYGSTGYIHFEGSDVNGSFKLHNPLNYDNYK